MGVGVRWEREGGDGIVALGKMGIWVCEARYHAKQHEKWRRKKLQQNKRVNQNQSKASARELNQKLISLKPNGVRLYISNFGLGLIKS